MLSPAEWEALRLSARVALWATLLCLPLGICVGWLLARREFRGKFLVEALVQLPMVLPPVVPGLRPAAAARHARADRPLAVASRSASRWRSPGRAR